MDQSAGMLWSWSGTGATVPYADTAIDGLPGSAGDGWPVALHTGYTWSVLALNGSGQIMGAAFGVKS
jgi:hypothetical protein